MHRPLLIGFAVLCAHTAFAQSAHDPLLVQEKARLCADPAQPPAQRVASCTHFMQRGRLANSAYAAALEERAEALEALGRRDEAIADYSHAISLAPRDVVAYSDRAMLYLASDRLDAGIADLTRVLGIEPANATALYNRGVAYQRRGDLDKALADLRSAASSQPPFAAAQQALATLSQADTPPAVAEIPGAVIGDYPTVRKNANVCADPMQPPAARVTSCTLVRKQTVLAGAELARVLDNRANAFMALGRRDEALTDLSAALTANPRDEIGLASRATLYIDMNRPDLADADLTRLKLINPGNGTTFYNAGVAEQRTGALARALDDYRKAVLLLPSFAPAHLALGVLLKAQDPSAALVQFNQAIELDPQSPALKSRASLNLSAGRFAQAVSDFDQVIAHDGTDSLAYLNRGAAKEQLEDLDGALADYDRSITAAASTSAYFDRANLYVRLEQPERALADFDAALTIDPKNIKALLGRADVHYGARRLAQSRDDYSRAIALDPKNAAAFFSRGSVYFDMGDFAAAYRDYSASLGLDPNQPDVLRNRALAAQRMGSSLR
jgi:tetratricopeptide (TPR) repeat protein